MHRPAGTATKRSRSALTLTEAVLGVLLCVALLVALQVYGYAVVLAALVLLVLAVLWGLAYLRAPDLTTNGTVLLVLALVTLAWVPGWLLDRRESARRQTVANNFRRIGQTFQAIEDTGPRGNLEQRFREHERIREAEAASR